MIKVNGKVIEIGKFPDGTPKINLDVDKIKKHEYYKETYILVEWFYQDNAEIFYLMLIRNHLDTCFAGIDCYLLMPYIPKAISA